MHPQKTLCHSREDIIKLLCQKNKDGGNIKSIKTANFFKDKRLHLEKIEMLNAINAIFRGRFILCSFYLNDKQWNNFYTFHSERPTEIIDRNILNNGCSPNEGKLSGHAIILIEVKENYLKFLNSWGSGWGEGGTFKIEINSITEFRMEFFDLYFIEKELTIEERDYYYKNIDFIIQVISQFDNANARSIINRMNNLNENRITCDNCRQIKNLNKYKFFIDKGLYYISCPSCNYAKQTRNLKRMVNFKRFNV